MHTAEASKQKAAVEALERQLEAALARASMLQGQLESEISGHGDTQASLQRAQAQVQPSIPLCLGALAAYSASALCATDRCMAAITGDERGGPACAEPGATARSCRSTMRTCSGMCRARPRSCRPWPSSCSAVRSAIGQSMQIVDVAGCQG